MKIVFDQPDRDIGPIEQHARYLHHRMLKEHKLPLIAGIDRALVQGTCDKCDSPCWVHHMTWQGLCDSCKTAAADKRPGF